MSEIRVDRIINNAGNGPVELTQGLTVPPGAPVSGISGGISSTSSVNTTGIITASSFSGPLTGNVTGSASYASTAGIATYASTAGIATYASTAGVSTYSGVSGFSTFSGYSDNAGIATYTSEWILGANGTTDYTFTGPGFTAATNDPTLYLIRGQQYKFTNTMGMHPFRIQSTPNGSVGTQYNTGITNNDVTNGTLTWNVAFDTPSILYYQCTAHASMGGRINIIDIGVGIRTEGSFVGAGVTLFDFRGPGISTVTISSGIATVNITGGGGGGGLTISDDTSTNATRYVPFTSSTTGSVSAANVSSTKLQFNPSTGTLSATIFTSLSDRTQKTNITPIVNAIETTKQLEGVKFNWKDNNQPSIGVIAQDIEKVLPEIVNTDDEGIKSVNYASLIGLLVEAIKEQQVRIEELERKIDA